jgi:tripartite-type tricarboxylate transporter receptor subunit TctC
MMLTRTLVGLGLALSVTAVSAQDYPTRPMTMVVAAAAGGPIDVFGRVLAERMGAILGQRLLIENVGGGGGTLGGQHVVRSPADGYTMLLGTLATHANPQLLSAKPLYSPVSDFVPVTLIAELPLVLIARKDFPANTIEEFAAYAKANPGKLNYGSAGVGSSAHLGCVMLSVSIGADTQHVPYRGTAPAMQDLQAGRLDFQCEIAVTAVPNIQGGAVKAIATLAKDRTPVLPDLPTAAEKGFRVEAQTWAGLFLPKGTPAPVAAKLREAASSAIDTVIVRDQLQKLGAVLTKPEQRSGEYLARYVQSEIDKWAKPIQSSGAVPKE